MKATVSERGCQHRLRRSAGATLVEVIIAIVLTAIVLVSLASAVSLSTSKSADLLWQVKAVELGESYLEEILGKRFDENSPVGGIPACHSSATACGAVGPDGESRAAYDDVDDYHGLDESPPQDSDGVARSLYTGYRVQVQVSYVSAATVTALGLSATDDAKLIEVTVTPPGGSAMTFAAYKGNY
ncbi:MAG: hypothetical protein KDI36_01915 [Pseudomonadales bacterium]|nr:hypothetical protein [Pseudomonadales bacterium]